jgi:hypothetical protein
LGLALGALVIMTVPNAALASVTAGCTGDAIILGETYTPANDTPKNAIPIPDQDGVEATYSGSVTFENKNHEGSITVRVGPFGIGLGDWEGSNQQDDRGVTNQIYELDDFRDKLPVWIPGVWKVTATHSASGGECSGFVVVKLAGSPFSSPVGWIVIAGLIGVAYLTIRATMKRRMVAAAIAAVFSGLFLALALMIFGVKPLDSLTTVVMPLALAIIAVVVAMYRPRSPFSG